MKRNHSNPEQRQPDDVVTRGPDEGTPLPGKNSDDRTREPIPARSGAPDQESLKVAEALRRQGHRGDSSADFDRNV